MSQKTVAEELKERIYECLALASVVAKESGEWSIHNALTLARMRIDDLVPDEGR